ncbi:MAG: hypothetical protein QM699_06515 [Amaricoccus sp.]|uniref:hypothetical protein n=1 Tax=Amaricoccus sp. TaxID=1872485 RepID=UPI0039E54A06
MRGTKFLLGLVALAAVVVVGGTAAGASERTVVEELIAAQNPCQGLRTKQFGVSIGVDRLKDVRLDTATVHLQGDRLSMDLDGRLACETSPGAAISGDAAATVRAEAELALADCAIDALDVRLTDFGGSLGPILAAFAPRIEAELRKAAEPKLRAACRDLRGTAD